jgi:predicted DNA-binding transcriptional regulator AlpA
MAVIYTVEVSPLAGRIVTVAKMVDGSPETVKRMVNQGLLPRPFKMTPRGEPRWWMPDVRVALAKLAQQAA